MSYWDFKQCPAPGCRNKVPTFGKFCLVHTRAQDTLTARQFDAIAGPTITCACGVKKTSYGSDGKTTNSPCPFCGRPDPRTLPRSASWPFDPDPPKLIPAENGFIYCRTCEKSQPASGHECEPATIHPDLLATLDRAEFAESLLCAMAFDHKREMWVSPEFGSPDVDGHDGFWVDCQVAVGSRRCAFCDAESDLDEALCDAARKP